MLKILTKNYLHYNIKFVQNATKTLYLAVKSCNQVGASLIPQLSGATTHLRS